MTTLVRKMRKRKGVTLVELAAAIDVSKTTLQAIETGRVSPRLSQLEAIAGVLGVYIEDLYRSPYSAPRATSVI